MSMQVEYHDDNDILYITSTDWKYRYAYFPTKLTNGKWVWLKQYYVRFYTGLNHSGFISNIERVDIFHVITNPVNAIFSPDMWENGK